MSSKITVAESEEDLIKRLEQKGVDNASDLIKEGKIILFEGLRHCLYRRFKTLYSENEQRIKGCLMGVGYKYGSAFHQQTHGFRNMEYYASIIKKFGDLCIDFERLMSMDAQLVEEGDEGRLTSDEELKLAYQNCNSLILSTMVCIQNSATSFIKKKIAEHEAEEQDDEKSESN